jgi:ADP-ribosylglycohydrolase
MGQLTGDSLGSQVEFQEAKEIKWNYPKGVRYLADGGPFNLIAGQPTDDSEMALALARSILARGAYEPGAAFHAYLEWHSSKPFDCGRTIAEALSGRLNPDSQANGALMRVSPLAIHGALKPRESLKAWAMADAALTHPNQLCQDANALFVLAIAEAIQSGPSPQSLYDSVMSQALELKADPALFEAAAKAAQEAPPDYSRKMGWALIAFQNALWQLLHAPNLEEALVDTVGRGGDTDTNAAICGALLGAVYGLEAIPWQWRQAVLGCRPQAGLPGVRRPRPEIYWPGDALELAALLLGESQPAS